MCKALEKLTTFFTRFEVFKYLVMLFVLYNTEIFQQYFVKSGL